MEHGSIGHNKMCFGHGSSGSIQIIPRQHTTTININRFQITSIRDFLVRVVCQVLYKKGDILGISTK